MRDPRDEQYARLLVETCIDVQPGWQVLVLSGLARPSALRRGLPGDRAPGRVRAAARRVSRSGLPVRRSAWVNEASDELLSKPAPIEEHVLLNVDALVAIVAPENTRDAADVEPRRMQLLQRARARISERLISGGVPWVGCQYPTPALAQDAGMTLRAVRGLPLRLGAARLGGRARTDDEDQGAVRRGDGGPDRRRADGPSDRPRGPRRKDRRRRREHAGRRGLLQPGRGLGRRRRSSSRSSPPSTRAASVEGSAYASRAGGSSTRRRASNEEFLLETLDTDEGARRLGELGIGCNPGITRYMKNTLFDEKINGTVHLAVGTRLPRPRRHERQRDPLGHRQGRAPGGRLELDGTRRAGDGRGYTSSRAELP